MDTDAKILAFLSVRPQTSEELWKYSRIHKNTMVKRLTKLVERNCIIKHRYALPYNSRNYGYLLNYRPTAKNGRIYYLLNCSSKTQEGFLATTLEKQIFLVKTLKVNWKKEYWSHCSKQQIRNLFR